LQDKIKGVNMNEESLAKYKVLPDMIYQWIEPYFGEEMVGRKILDFGCGFGETALGFASKFPKSQVMGVDVFLDADRLKLGIENVGIKEIPKNIEFKKINPGENLVTGGGGGGMF
jgi:ubiquinone/menaquinone biosynthesis C-methylase UbiE